MLFGAIKYFTLAEGEFNELNDMFDFDGARYMMSAEYRVLDSIWGICRTVHG